MALEIGSILEILFVDILKWHGYVSLTGNAVEVLIKGFLLPTIVIIFGIYFITKKIEHLAEHDGLRLLIGVGIYLFIIVNGWYGGFAQITQAYFIFLIVILGILFFIPEHFGRKGGKSRQSKRGGGLSLSKLKGGEKASQYKNLGWKDKWKRINKLEREIDRLEKRRNKIEEQVKMAQEDPKKETAEGIARMESKLTEIDTLISEKEEEIRELREII